MKRFLFIGSVDYSARCLRELLSLGVDVAEVMCPYPEACKNNSDYVDLASTAAEFRKSVRYFTHISEEVEYIKNLSPDIIFVLGLSQILPKAILKIPSV